MEIRDFKECQRELQQILARASELYKSVNIDALKERASHLDMETQKEEIWQNKERFALVNRELSSIRRKIDPWNKLMNDITETRDLLEIALEENDVAVLTDIYGKLPSFEKKFKDLETVELLSGNDDFNNVFITIHPGAGGTESQDWASMLFRMYYRWSEEKGLKLEVIDYTPGDEAGIKSATMLVQGDYAFGFLKGEQGVHRLVRISPFDANKRRHTSFASVEAAPEVSEEIEIDIKESDLRIDTYRSSGAGGQGVNRTDSAVRITHLPSGLVVQCQNERSQHKNKAFAMKVLKSRLYKKYKAELDEKMQERIGEKKDISWGNQIRSYVFQPYTMVKDHRTGEETGSVEHVFDGDIDRFIYAYLKYLRMKK